MSVTISCTWASINQTTLDITRGASAWVLFTRYATRYKIRHGYWYGWPRRVWRGRDPRNVGHLAPLWS